MAKKSTGPSFREVMTSIKKGQFAPVYLLMGEEAYYIDELTRALEKFHRVLWCGRGYRQYHSECTAISCHVGASACAS